MKFGLSFGGGDGGCGDWAGGGGDGDGGGEPTGGGGDGDGGGGRVAIGD